MKFTKTINLNAEGIQDALRSGALKLQRGQWVRCGEGKPSRFVGFVGQNIWAIHWQPQQAERFSDACRTLK